MKDPIEEAGIEMDAPSVPQLRPCPVCGGYHSHIDIHGGAWQAASILTDNKWALVVLYLLSRGGAQRYGQLREAVVGVTQKMLTQTLRHLERDGLVQRVVHPSVPPRVEYSLTHLGCTLVSLVEEMCIWAVQHYPEIEEARARYDGATQRAPDECS